MGITGPAIAWGGGGILPLCGDDAAGTLLLCGEDLCICRGNDVGGASNVVGGAGPRGSGCCCIVKTGFDCVGT